MKCKKKTIASRERQLALAELRPLSGLNVDAPVMLSSQSFGQYQQVLIQSFCTKNYLKMSDGSGWKNLGRVCENGTLNC